MSQYQKKVWTLGGCLADHRQVIRVMPERIIELVSHLVEAPIGHHDEEAENGGDDNQSSDEDYRSSDDEHEGRSPLSKAQLVNPKDRKHSYVLWQHCRFLRTLALSNHKLRRFMRDDYEEEFSFFLSSSHFLTKFDHRLEFARLAKQDLLEIVRVVGFSVGEEHEQGAAS